MLNFFPIQTGKRDYIRSIHQCGPKKNKPQSTHKSGTGKKSNAPLGFLKRVGVVSLNEDLWFNRGSIEASSMDL